MNTIKVWLQGDKDVKKVVPLGYAGNPAAYEKKLSDVRKIYEILSEYIADKIN